MNDQNWIITYIKVVDSDRVQLPGPAVAKPTPFVGSLGLEPNPNFQLELKICNSNRDSWVMLYFLSALELSFLQNWLPVASLPRRGSQGARHHPTDLELPLRSHRGSWRRGLFRVLVLHRGDAQRGVTDVTTGPQTDWQKTSGSRFTRR